MNLRNRLSSVFLDMMLIILVAMIVMVPTIVSLSLAGYTEGKMDSTVGFTVATALIWAILFNKDAISGRSVGKVRFNFQVVDRNMNPASQIQCIVRNLTVFIWPIEVIVMVFNPTRRLGDFIAGTQVIYYENKPEIERGHITATLPYILIMWLAMFFVIRFTSSLF